MNIVLKPGGIILLLIAFATVSTAAILVYKKKSVVAAPIIISNGNMGNERTPAPTDAGAEPPDEEELAADNWRMIGDASLFTTTWVKGPNEQYPKAKEYTIKKVPKGGPWDIQTFQPIEDAVPAGSRIQVRFWARSNDSGEVVAVIEKQAPPYTRLIAKEIRLSPQWRSFTLETRAPQALPSGWAKVGLQLATRPSVIDIAGAEVVVVKQP